MFKCKYFLIEELVPRDLFMDFRDNQDALWMLFDSRALMTQDYLRARYGKITVNNWLWGGDREYCGFRPWNLPIGSLLSQHKFGRAFDNHFEKVSAEKVREDMRKRGCFLPGCQRDEPRLPPEFSLITRIEADVDWFHFDVGNWDTLWGIKIIKP